MTREYYLDKDQLERLQKDIATILEHLFDVTNVLTRQTNYGKQPGHSPDSPLPYSEKASRFLHELVYGVPAICEAAGHTPRIHNQLTPYECLYWLQANPMKLAVLEDAPQHANTINQWAKQIVYIVDRPRYPDLIGLCPNCEAPIYSYHDKGEVQCDCGETIDIAILKAEYWELLGRMSYTREELNDYLQRRGVPKTTRNRWLREITTMECEGRPLWPMSAVTKKLEEWLRGKTA